MAFNPQDRFFKQAKKENYVARSIYKLKEIDERFNIFKRGAQVLDLGASPGSWSQYASEKIGKDGFLIGVDLTPIEIKIHNGYFVASDIRDVDISQILLSLNKSNELDIVMSDMAPKTTGIKFTDQARSFELCMLSLEIAQKYLKKNGVFICKLFHSDDFQELKKEILKSFTKFEAIKPESTRSMSKEIFLVGLKKK